MFILKYELFMVIDKEIEELRSTATKKKGKKFYRVAYGGGRKPPEDLTDADEICDCHVRYSTTDYNSKTLSHRSQNQFITSLQDSTFQSTSL